MHQITVVSLGAGPREQLTLGALETLEKAKRLILRTGEIDAAACLRERGLQFETLDELHEQCEDFDAFIAAAVERVKRAAARANAVYAVLDATNDETVAALLHAYPDHVRLGAGMPLYAPLLQAAGAQLPARICSATSLTVPETQDGLLVTEMNTRQLAGECKLKLAAWYGDEAEAMFFPPARTAKREFIRIPLYELDRQPRYDHTAAVYLPPVELTRKERYDLWDLTRVLRRLRGENGCPWDREQTHKTLARYLIEEAYETSQAVNEEDWDHVAEELGDVLLQVVFHAAIAESQGRFTVRDVATGIVQKLIYRHPHVFGSVKADTAEQVLVNWDRLKKAEKHQQTQTDAMKSVPRGFPALMRSRKVQKKAADVGFDWDSAEAAFPKISEEAEELRAAMGSGEGIAEEMGDLLFAVVNVARLLHLEPEFLLQEATDKFIGRFSAMEALALSRGTKLENLSFSEQDELWSLIKNTENRAKIHK